MKLTYEAASKLAEQQARDLFAKMSDEQMFNSDFVRECLLGTILSCQAEPEIGAGSSSLPAAPSALQSGAEQDKCRHRTRSPAFDYETKARIGSLCLDCGHFEPTAPRQTEEAKQRVADDASPRVKSQPDTLISNDGWVERPDGMRGADVPNGWGVFCECDVVEVTRVDGMKLRPRKVTDFRWTGHSGPYDIARARLLPTPKS